MKNPFTRVNQLPIMWVLLSRGMNLHRNYWWVFFLLSLLHFESQWCLKVERLFQSVFFPQNRMSFFSQLFACCCVYVFISTRICIHAHLICSSFCALLFLSMTVSTNLDTTKIAVHLKSCRWHLRCRNVRNKTRAKQIECGDALSARRWPVALECVNETNYWHTALSYRQTNRQTLPTHTHIAGSIPGRQTNENSPFVICKADNWSRVVGISCWTFFYFLFRL